MNMLTMIRHGRTEGNARRWYYGALDLPLSEQGAQQLREAAACGVYPAYDGQLVVTSGLLRTEQTLEILCGSVPHTALPGLREMDFGAFEMKSYSELKDDPDFRRWCAGDNEANRCPGGESANKVTQRALAALAPILADGSDTLCVTHGGVIAGVLARWFGGNRFDWTPQPGCGYCVEAENGAPRTVSPFPGEIPHRT